MDVDLILAVLAIVFQAVAVVWTARIAVGAISRLTWFAMFIAMCSLLGLELLVASDVMRSEPPGPLNPTLLALASGSFMIGMVCLLPTTQRLRAAVRLDPRLSDVLDLAERDAGFGYWLGEIDTSGYAMVSDGLARLHGTSVDDFMRTGEDFDEDIERWVHPDDRERVRSMYDAWSDENAEIDVIYRIVRADGATRYVRDRARYINTGGRTVQIGTLQDVTDFKETELELRESLARAHDLTAQIEQATRLAKIGHWTMDVQTGEARISDSLAHIHGTTVDDMAALVDDFEADIQRWVHPDDQARVLEASRRSEDTETPFDEVYRIVRKDGAVRHIRDISTYVTRDDGPAVPLGSMRDITDEVTTRERLTEALHRAEASDQAKTVFLAMLSHELRTPLNAVIGYAQLIRVRGTDGLEGHTTAIESAGHHLLGIIADILEAARLDLSETPLNETTFDAVAPITSAVSVVLGQDTSGPEAVSVDPPVQSVSVTGDERALRQVFINVLSNARQHTPSDGALSVSIAVNDTGLEYRVTDTGCGMTESEIDIALTPFGKVGNDANLASTGLGLGLPIAKGWVERHAGSFSIASVPGNGTTVSVRLPADRIQPANTA